MKSTSFMSVVRWLIPVIMAALLHTAALPAFAHAELLESLPAGNAQLDSAPAEIRLIFTEPVEPDFSQFSLRTIDGSVVSTPPSQIDPLDPYALIMQPGALPDGIYTVTWRVVSAADGHSTSGSFPFGIGVAIDADAATDDLDAAIPIANAIIRWAHLLYIALTIGGLAFMALVWIPNGFREQVAADHALASTTFGAWALLGVTHVLMLALQTAITSDVPLREALSFSLMERVLSATRFGQLWLMQLALWAGIGVLLIVPRPAGWERRLYTLALIGGVAFIFLHSQFSHASASGGLVGVSADAIHLGATALWFGGLVLLVQVIAIVRTQPDGTASLARLVAAFSNFARACVIALLLTGVYAAWLHVGSLEALLNTPYGQALVIKGGLMLPLLGIALVNLTVTHRALRAGQAIWSGRLQRLVGLEIGLIAAMLVAVGVMTSIPPARTAYRPDVPMPDPIVETETVDGMTIQLAITPGTVGENQFAVTLTDADGAPIEDASLVRMRFNHQTAALGESELRPTHTGGGVYAIDAANLSVAGAWRIRVSVQRPGEFDAVATFEITVDAPQLAQAAG